MACMYRSPLYRDLRLGMRDIQRKGQREPRAENGMGFRRIRLLPMLTTDTAIHSKTRYCIITQYILQDCSIASGSWQKCVVIGFIPVTSIPDCRLFIGSDHSGGGGCRLSLHLGKGQKLHMLLASFLPIQKRIFTLFSPSCPQTDGREGTNDPTIQRSNPPMNPNCLPAEPRI